MFNAKNCATSKTTLARYGYTEHFEFNHNNKSLNIPLLIFACNGPLDAPDIMPAGNTIAKGEGLNGKSQYFTR